MNWIDVATRFVFPYRNKTFCLLLIKLFLMVFLLLQSVYSLSVYDAMIESKLTEKNALSLRLSLDVSHIKSKFNMGKHSVVQDMGYIDQLNQVLTQKEFSYRLVAISITPINELTNNQTIISLEGINDTLYFLLQESELNIYQFFSIWPFLIAVLFALVVAIRVYHSHVRQNRDDKGEIDPCIMKIDLLNKQLINPLLGTAVALANKPLCFYTALIELSIQDSTRQLNPNKELPNELDLLAKKYFSRLIELGHTIRKRPNFANNVEKTLSEIRAALDELYGEDIAVKELLYPPKAVGEGSRSKAHNYALTGLTYDQIVILGQ